MKTLDRVQDQAVAELALERRSRRSYAAIGAVMVVVAVVAASVAYMAASPHTVTKTKTLVVTKPVATPNTLAPTCAPGAAPGSCNVDEAREASIPDRPLDAATRTELAAQLTAARGAALRYPTVADAAAAGFVPAGKFSPETGAHYIKLAQPDGSFDPSNPGSLIYDGDSPTSKVVGTMYIAGTAAAPPGFAGPNDHWHRHQNTCVIFGGGKIVVPFAADSSVTAAQCAAVHGTFMKTTVWMVHAWVVPSWESPLGVFSHENPNVKCADGTVKTDAVGFCKGT